MIEHDLVRQAADEAPCQHEGCSEIGFACNLPDDQYEAEYYCGQHAFEHGYCRLCGGFFGGTESFEFRNGGYCDDCLFQMRDAVGENDEDEEPDADWDPEAEAL